MPTLGSQIEHSNSSQRCRHSWLACPVEASFLTETKAGYVCATSQHVYFRKTPQKTKSLGPLATFPGGFPSDRNGGKRPPDDLHTCFNPPTSNSMKSSSIQLIRF